MEWPIDQILLQHFLNPKTFLWFFINIVARLLKKWGTLNKHVQERSFKIRAFISTFDSLEGRKQVPLTKLSLLLFNILILELEMWRSSIFSHTARSYILERRQLKVTARRRQVVFGKENSQICLVFEQFEFGHYIFLCYVWEAAKISGFIKKSTWNVHTLIQWRLSIYP